MKKLLLLAIAGIAGYVAYTKQQKQHAQQDLWAEATDNVTGSR